MRNATEEQQVSMVRMHVSHRGKPAKWKTERPEKENPQDDPERTEEVWILWFDA